MDELVKFIVKSLIGNDNFVITSEGDAITVTVPKKDIGKVIGKQGRIAKAIRTVLKAACHENKVSLDIVEAAE